MADSKITATDPALVARARLAFAKLDAGTKEALRTAGISEQSWEQSAVARFAADAKALGGGLHFDAEALAKDHLLPLDDVSPEEEADARQIGEALAALTPTASPEAASQALAKAQAALDRLQANPHVPPDIFEAYKAQVAGLKGRVGEVKPAAPATREERDQAMLVKIYQDVHGRLPDPGGAKFWGERIKEMRAGGMSDEAIVAKMEQDGRVSPEYQMKHGGGSYVVQPGDTLEGLAPLFGTTAEALAAKNGLDEAAGLVPGAGLKWQIAPAEATALAASRATARSAAAATGAGQAASAGGPVTPAGTVPYINQYSDSLYNNGSNCGPTSMAMIARAFGYGKGMSNGQLIADLGKAGGTTEAGSGWAGIQAMAARMGKGCVSHPPDAAWLKQQLEAGKLVCANGDYYALPPHGGGSGGHYVAIVGLDKNGNFLVDDPADRSISPKAYTAAQIEHFLKANGNGGQVFAVG